MRLSRHPGKRIDWKMYKTEAGSARVLATVLAMTDNTPDWGSDRLISSSPTQTPTLVRIARHHFIAEA